MPYDSHEGYRDAARIDKIINRVLNAHKPGEKSNRAGYQALIRTVHTSLNIIRRQVGLRQAGTHVSTLVED